MDHIYVYFKQRQQVLKRKENVNQKIKVPFNQQIYKISYRVIFKVKARIYHLLRAYRPAIEIFNANVCQLNGELINFVGINLWGNAEYPGWPI